MNKLTFCEIKYVNRLFFFKGRVYDWGWFQNTDSHTRTKIPQSSPPHDHRGYERVYKFKEQYMNKLTFCEIKYVNRLFFFSKAGLGLVSKY